MCPVISNKNTHGKTGRKTCTSAHEEDMKKTGIISNQVNNVKGIGQVISPPPAGPQVIFPTLAHHSSHIERDLNTTCWIRSATHNGHTEHFSLKPDAIVTTSTWSKSNINYNRSSNRQTHAHVEYLKLYSYVVTKPNLSFIYKYMLF
jgi:hypothetical protein